MRDFELEGITLLISSRDHSENWRCEPDTVANVNSVLKQFIGSRYFHNYTSGTTGGRGGAADIVSLKFVQCCTGSLGINTIK